jgi:hypothetical protein
VVSVIDIGDGQISRQEIWGYWVTLWEASYVASIEATAKAIAPFLYTKLDRP